ncbi:MAG TPA: GTPase ObgE, partial [Flavobacteriales bacterium]|nr:GTPase ObgE [Flavobacteriales bacterium]
LRHIERNPVLLFLVPADANDIRTEYETLLNELEKYNPDLLKKNRLLAVSKADMLDDELEEAMRAEIEDLDPIFFSSVAQQGLQQLKDRIWQSMESATVW